jgi:hypothetical protein
VHCYIAHSSVDMVWPCSITLGEIALFIVINWRIYNESLVRCVEISKHGQRDDTKSIGIQLFIAK